MKLLGINAATRELRWPLGSPYRLRLRMTDATGAYQDLTGREFVLAIYRTAIIVSADGVIGSDATSSYAEFYFDGSANAAIAAARGPIWEIAELFTDGKAMVLAGAVYIADAAPVSEVGHSSSSSFDETTWTPDTDALIISETGSRGLNAFDYALNFTIDNAVYIPAQEAMTIALGVAPIGTGALSYAKSTAAAPESFATTSLPATVEAGAWLRVSATGVISYLAVHLVRSN